MTMSPNNAPIPYQNLADIADHLFDACEDDVKCLSRKIEALNKEVRNELLVSDLLNAWQVFYYFFRVEPDELMQERLELEPASSLLNGIIVDDIDPIELIFSITDTEPVIIVSDGEQPLATYKGRNAYAEGQKFIENPPY